MGTIVTRSIIDQIIANNGYGDKGDPRTVKIVQYKNMEDQIVFGTVLDVETRMLGMAERYEQVTEYIYDPEVIWVADGWCCDVMCPTDVRMHQRTSTCAERIEAPKA